MGAAAVARVDAGLSDIAATYDYLTAVTPVNADDAWAAFRSGGCREAPVFAYAPVRADLETLRERLEALPVDEVDDDALSRLFAAKRRELLLQLTLAESLGRPAFLEASLELYGGVDDALLVSAGEVLDVLPVAERAAEAGGDLDGVAFAARCEAELARYRRAHPGFDATVRIDPAFPGVMVSGREVIVGPGHRVARARAEALVQHEVGTHVVTNVNGAGQPLRLLGEGLAGYEETQEGLAVFAEYVAGQLTIPRLAVIAARVIGTRRLLDGAGFAEVFTELVDGVGLREDRAWELAMRTWRGGGLTKDVIYLRGLARVLRHVAEGGSVEALTLGKFDLADLPLVERLRDRGTLRPPAVSPRWLELSGAAERLAAARAGTLLSLVPGLWRPAAAPAPNRSQ